MIIGIISDTHDHLENMKSAIKAFKERGAERLVHCGDLVAPFMVGPMIEAGFEECVGVFGNNDGEWLWTNDWYAKAGRVLKPPAFIEMGGRRIAILHEPMPEDVMDALPVDIVAFGHTHEIVLKEGPPVILNPGEACGLLTGRATAAVLDTETMKVEIFDIA